MAIVFGHNYHASLPAGVLHWKETHCSLNLSVCGSICLSRCDLGKRSSRLSHYDEYNGDKRIHEMLRAFHSVRLELPPFNWERGFLIIKSLLLYSICSHTATILQGAFHE